MYSAHYRIGRENLVLRQDTLFPTFLIIFEALCDE